MSATRILWGQIVTVFLIVLTTIWGATEWVAWRLGFQPQLGTPWFDLAGFPFYYPPAFFWWWYAYDAYAPPIFVERAVIAASGGFLSIGVAIMMSVWRAREAQDVITYGSTRWAEPKEVSRSGLLGSDGVVLGKFEEHYLRHDGPELRVHACRAGIGARMRSYVLNPHHERKLAHAKRFVCSSAFSCVKGIGQRKPHP